MYTTTSKQQEGCTFKDSHPKCYITTNFDKFHREAFARGVNRGSKNALVERLYAIGRFVAFSGRGGRPITAFYHNPRNIE